MEEKKDLSVEQQHQVVENAERNEIEKPKEKRTTRKVRRRKTKKGGEVATPEAGKNMLGEEKKGLQDPKEREALTVDNLVGIVVIMLMVIGWEKERGSKGRRIE